MAHRVNKIAKKFWKVLKAYVGSLALCSENSLLVFFFAVGDTEAVTSRILEQPTREELRVLSSDALFLHLLDSSCDILLLLHTNDLVGQHQCGPSGAVPCGVSKTSACCKDMNGVSFLPLAASMV